MWGPRMAVSNRFFKQSMCAAVLVVPFVAALGQDYPPLKRVPVLSAPIPSSNPSIKLVRGARIQFAPKQPTGLHLHPVSTVGIVTEGSFLFQPEGESVRTLHVGDSFFEPAGKRILHFDNASSKDPAAIVVYYLTDSDKTPLITLLPK
jgi:quercetin dioxygenase-like cupin family protein